MRHIFYFVFLIANRVFPTVFSNNADCWFSGWKAYNHPRTRWESFLPFAVAHMYMSSGAAGVTLRRFSTNTSGHLHIRLLRDGGASRKPDCVCRSIPPSLCSFPSSFLPLVTWLLPVRLTPCHLIALFFSTVLWGINCSTPSQSHGSIFAVVFEVSLQDLSWAQKVLFGSFFPWYSLVNQPT